ncbi:MAG: PAS domain S-box protein [Thermodesulfobacteriota bacterium]|nr:PAS domain S-box protein [Thermodesulfobacteriota bacterium]
MNKESESNRIETMTDAVLKAAGGDYSLRLDTSDDGDALARLAHAINTMVDKMGAQAGGCREMEAAVRKCEDKYRHLEANIPGMVYHYALHPDGTHSFPYANALTRQLFDIDPEDLMADGTLLSGLIHPGDRERRDESIKESAETLQPWRQELRHIVNGEVRWHECMARPELQPNGDILWDGIMLDITERKRVEEALSDSEARHRQVVEAMNDALALADADGVLTYVNPRFLEMLAKEAEEVIGCKFIDFLDETNGRIWVKEQARRKEGISTTYELELTRGDGDRIFVVASGAPLWDEEGQYTGSIGVLTDVTALKQAEKHLKKYQKMLDESQRLAHVGSWELDLHTDALVLSDEVYRIFGYGPQAIQLSFEGFIRGLHPEDQKRILRHHKETLRTKVFEEIKYRVIRPDGAVRWISATGTVFTGAGGTPARIVGTVQDITQRRHYEERLRMFQFSVAQAPDGVFWIEQDGAFSYVNEQACRSLGYDREELMGLRLWELDPDFSEERWARQWEELGRLGTKTFETIHRHKDGHVFDVEISAKHIFFGETEFHVAFARDITDRKRAQGALKDEAMRRRILVEQSSDGIVVLDEKGKVYEANQRYADMLGYSMEEVYQLHVWDWDTQWTQEQLGEMIRTVDEGGDHFETRHLRKDGTSYDVEISTNGAVCGGQKLVFCVCRDITERKRAEEALRQSEALLNATQRLIKVGGWEWDVGKETMYWTKETYRIHDFDPDEIEAGSEEHISKGLACYEPQDRAVITSAFEDCVKEGRSYDLEFPFTTATGRNIWIRTTAEPVMDEGHVVKVVGNIMDITERKRAEAEKAKLETQLRRSQKLETIGTLSGGIAHDFNNILGIIIGNAELALDEVPGWNPAHFNMEEIKTASLRAKDIVRQLLTFSRTVELKKEPLQLIAVVKDSLKFLRSTIPTTIDIRRNIQAKDDIIMADPTQIHQVMMNLCANAAQAMEKTGGVLSIDVENVTLDAEAFPDLPRGRYVKLTVSDTGPGIAPEIRDRVFDPYFTTKDVGKGSGMGLAVVHGIIKNHSGAISVDSESGKGATFTILFPLTAEKPQRKVETLEEIPRGTETILFVDDEESIVTIGRQMLERLGYRVQTATTPQHALALFKAHPSRFDLVITDMTMPQMTGEALFGEVKNIREDVPVIIATGHSSLMDKERAKKIGLAAYVMKPLNRRDIASTVRNVLDGKGKTP